jgi:CubicO group peptidase (beta-lactamase class C family)
MPDRWASLQQLLNDGVRRGVYTGAVALVGLQGEMRWQGVAGTISREPGAPAVTPDTVFDLASLTKPLATTLALMVLADRGRLRLSTPLGEVLPAAWLPPDKQPLTLRSLLTHRAGLPAWRPFYSELPAAPAPERSIRLARLAAAVPLEQAPDTVTLYSDLGFILLGAAVEHLGEENLDQFCREEIYRPLKLTGLGFNPRQQPGGGGLAFAATELGLIPGRAGSGEVHDENAWAAGGVAGHAGLFGTGAEVFRLVACLYQAYTGQAAGPLTPETVRRFFTVPPGAQRAHGFDTPDPEPARRAAGRYFSPRSVGHLGFTGTSFWLDLESSQEVVLLTNRVLMGRDDKTGINALRPRFHEAASRALGFN